MSTEPNDLILDSFAGTGTTGHAVMQINEDGGDRKFILVELESEIAKNKAAARIVKVIKSLSGGGGGAKKLVLLIAHLAMNYLIKMAKSIPIVRLISLPTMYFFIETHKASKQKEIIWYFSRLI